MVLQVMGKDSSMLCQVLVQGMSWEEIQLHKVFFFQSKWKHCGLSYSKNTNYYYKNISAETITYGRLIWNQIFWWKYLDAWNNIWCSSPHIAVLLVENVCVIACHVYSSNFMSVSRSKIQLMLIFLKIWKGLRMCKCGKVLDQNQQIFDFVDVSLFVSLFKGNPAEPLYLVKVAEKGTDMTKNTNDPYGHFIQTSELFFKRSNLKLTRSLSLKKKIIQILLTCVLFPLMMYLILT